MSCPECEGEIESLKFNMLQTQQRLRILEKEVETLWTPPWKKLWFLINGWPLYHVVERPKARPWHKWTGV